MKTLFDVPARFLRCLKSKCANEGRGPIVGWRTSAEGSISVVTAVLFLVILTVCGGAVDLTNAMRVKSKAQSHLDAGMLAVLRMNDDDAMTLQEREAILHANVLATMPQIGENAKITLRQDGVTYVGSIDFPSDNILLSVVGLPSFDVGVETRIKLLPPPPVDLALVLDSTFSMDGTKLATMKQAASELVVELTKNDGARISVVPFARYVNVGLVNRNETGLDISPDEGDEEVCTTKDDTEPQNCKEVAATCSDQQCTFHTDTCTNDGQNNSCEKNSCTEGPSYACTKQECEWVKTGTQTTSCTTSTGTNWKGCMGSREAPSNARENTAGHPVPGLLAANCGTPLHRLSSDTESLKTRISAITAAGDTYIPTGLLWGWRTISRNAPFPDANKGSDDAIVRAIVLMSDGINTVSKESGSIRHGGKKGEDANKLVSEICDAIKKEGIRIYAVAYEIDDKDGSKLLKKCATNPDTMFFDAKTSAELLKSFETISGSFQRMHISG